MNILSSAYFKRTVSLLLVASILPMLGLGLAFIGLFSGSIHQTAADGGRTQMEQISSEMDAFIMQSMQLSQTCANHMIVKSVLSYMPGKVELASLEDTLRLFVLDRTNQLAIHVVNQTHSFSTTQLPPRYAYEVFAQSTLFAKLDSLPRSAIMFSEPYVDALGNAVTLSIVVPVCDYHNRFVGYVIIDLYQDVFENLIKRHGDTLQMALWRDARLLFSTTEAALPTPTEIEQLDGYQPLGAASGRVARDDGVYFKNADGYNQLTRVFWLDTSEIDLIVDKAVSLLMLLIGLCVLLASALAFWMSIHQSKPIVKLLRGMDNVGQGDLSTRVDVKGHNELADLGRRFNQLVEQLDASTKANALREAELRKQELTALQAQINPHFIYNTLGAARSLIRLKMPDKASQIILHLSTLLHANFQNIDSFIPLQEDIKLIQSYMIIQNIRFNDRFRLHFDIPPEMMDYLLPALILQPIVENALLHGLEQRPDSGDIWIRFSAREQDMDIEIENNGIPISPETEQSLNANQPMAGHIGFFNVRRRIELYYGEGYTARIVRMSNGTKVILHMRLVQEGERSCIRS